jgi:outer membrane beta-barrel protein
VIKLLLVLMAALWLSVVAASWSEAAEDPDNEYNFSWLDPDKKVSVLQNRKYRKANRPMITLGYGFASTNAYRSSMVIDPRLAYYFNEAWGIEVFYSLFSNKENDTAKALATTSVRPDVIDVKSRMGALLHWVPWYAKINVFNNVLYFDWYFSGGIGSMNADMIPGSASAGATQSKSLTAYYLGTGQVFHVTENFVVRLDFTNTWFKAPIRAVSGEETFFNSSTFTVGAGFRL